MFINFGVYIDKPSYYHVTRLSMVVAIIAIV